MNTHGIQSAVEAAETPIPKRSPEEERTLLDSLTADPPATILVVSDLHIGQGLEKATGRFSRRENFFADLAFLRFLGHYHDRMPCLLALNGDIFDFLRIVDCPREEADFECWRRDLARLGDNRSTEDLRKSVSRHERRFGLQTDEFKSVYKLKAIARGHPTFFKALAQWIEAGGSLLYVKGNHDVQQHWPLIRRALRDEVFSAGAADAQIVADKVCYADEAWSTANLYVEHGHNYEGLTSVRGSPELTKPRGQLRFPLGSFVNRYVVNQLERIEPFIDNIKPVTEVLWTLARQRPLSVLQIIGRGARLLARALVRRRITHALLAAAIVAGGLAYLVPALVLCMIILYLSWPAFADWLAGLPLFSSPTRRVLLSVGGVLLPFVVAALKEIRRRLLRPKIGEDRVSAGVFRAFSKAAKPRTPTFHTQLLVLGHTHHQDVQELPAVGVGRERTLYVNSGTWAPLWPKGRPDLIGRTLYSYTLFTRENGEYFHEALLWNDSAGQPRPALLLTPERRR